MEQILLFNFNADKAAKIIAIASEHGIAIREVTGCEYVLKIKDILVSTKVVEDSSAKLAFIDEMMLFSDFSDELLSDFLHLMRISGVGAVPLKAAITMYNKNWTALDLCSELKKEYEEFLKKNKRDM